MMHYLKIAAVLLVGALLLPALTRAGQLAPARPQWRPIDVEQHAWYANCMAHPDGHSPEVQDRYCRAAGVYVWGP